MQAAFIALTIVAASLGGRNLGDGALDLYEAREISYTGGEYKDHVFKYRLMKPKNIEAGKKYPLVLYLHGAGERGSDNEKSLYYMPIWWSADDVRTQYPCYILVPQCPEEKMFMNYGWWLKEHSMSPEPADELKAVIAMLKHTMANEQVEADQVYLTGLSMGGFGSWDLASRHPDWFAAMVPICGGGDPAQASKLVNLPIWAWHGADDQAVTVDRSRVMIEAIKSAGGKPRYTELEHINHNSWSPAYNSPDLLSWLFSQKRAPQ